jgi:hypothetical protein
MSATHTLKNHSRTTVMTSFRSAIINERLSANFSTRGLSAHEPQNAFLEKHPRLTRWASRVRADRQSAILGCDNQQAPGIDADHTGIVKRDRTPAFTSRQIRRDVTRYQAVGCNQHGNSDALSVEVPLDSSLDESIAGATADFAGTDNVQGVLEPTVVAITGNTALVKFSATGLDPNAFCAGGGQVVIVVHFVINQRISVPQGCNLHR